MKNYRRVVGVWLLLLGIACWAQQPGKRPMPAPASAPMRMPLANVPGAEPKPAPAEQAVLAAFDRYQVVGLSAAHGNQDLDDFILRLVRSPQFPDKVRVIAVECGNAMDQPLLDRYIAGANVTLAEARKVWRDTTQTMCGLSGFYDQLFPLVRAINARLPQEKKLRMLACDTPIDWSTIKSPADYAQGRYLAKRDATAATVIAQEVFAKHTKALALFGAAHLYHVPGSAVGMYEKQYPGVTFVIADHSGFGNWTPAGDMNGAFEARMAGWPIPSLVQDLHGTWLENVLNMTQSTGTFFFGPPQDSAAKTTLSAETPADLGTQFSKMVDGYLYLGPRDLLLNEPAPAQVVLDKPYMAELQRRDALAGGFMTNEANPALILDRDSDPFFYDPEELHKLEQPPAPKLENLN